MTYILENDAESKRLNQQNNLENYNILNELAGIDLEGGSRVLDAGCGTGVVSSFLDRNFSSLTIDGCDFSADRLNLAKNSISPENSGRFFVSELSNIDAEEETYDHIFCRYVFEHLLDHRSVLREFRRILKHGGKLHIINFDGLLFNLYPISEQLKTLLETVKDKLKYDLEIGRKIPYLAVCEGFKVLNWRVDGVGFYGQSMNDEVTMMRQRLDAVSEYLTQLFGSREDFDSFFKLYIQAMNEEGATLFYNKFIVSLVK